MKHCLRSMALLLTAAPAVAAMPECVTVRTFAPYRNMGYDHLVEITNACGKVVACQVRTNVNPEPISVDVQPATTAEVLTFRGSPASTFEATVSCTPRG